LSEIKPGITIKNVCRWVCQECDAVGPRVTAENCWEILNRANRGRKEPITKENFGKPEGMTDEEWICRMHSVITHAKHENVLISTEGHVKISDEGMETIRAALDAKAKQNQTS